MRLFFNILITLFWIIYGSFIVVSATASLSDKNNSPLPFRALIVQSGSMEPTIMTGDLIFIQPQQNYTLEDVITFRDKENRTITHRITSVQKDQNKTSFITKGDNNKTADPELAEAEKIVGKYTARLPKAGYILTYAQKPTIIFLLLALPIMVIIGSELFKEKPAKKHIETE